MKNLTQKDIYEGIESYMVQFGEEPNCQELLEFLGRGSMGTVHRHLSTWRERSKYISTFKSPEKNGETTTICLPRAIGEAWAMESSRLQAAMSQELQALRAAHDQTIRVLEAELDILRSELDRQESEICIKNKQIGELTALLQNLSKNEQCRVEESHLRVITE